MEKEAQKSLFKKNDKITEEEFKGIIKMIAPGTHLRTAIEGSLKTGKGALILVENELTNHIIDGGFRVNTKFSPQKLAELTKMDGSIILSNDLKKIIHANVLLTPDHKIKSNETGTRHKAAERAAKQTGTLVIAISERKHEINLFYKNMKYHVRGTDELLRKANEYIQTLEKQRETFDKNKERLDEREIKSLPSLQQAITTLQKGLLIKKINQELQSNINELGKEGFLLKARLKEIMSGVIKEINHIINDYTKIDLAKTKNLLTTLTYDELLDEANILKYLAYESINQDHATKGHRTLSKTSLEDKEIGLLIKEMHNLSNILQANQEDHARIIGDYRAAELQEELDKIVASI
tara:strand:- start:1687 stop:2742 length:1056 start_codon:yes stop_codon:yes gene_type:complete